MTLLKDSWRLLLSALAVVAMAMAGLALYLARPACYADPACVVQATVGTLLVTFVLLGGVILISAWRQERNLRALHDMARRVREGNLQSHVLPRSGGSVADLARAMNEMVDTLSARIAVLDEENQQLSAALENMADGVLITDPAGTILLINPAAAKLFDLSAERALGRSYAEVVRHHQLIDLWQTCRREGREAVSAVEIGRSLYLQAFVTPLREVSTRGYLIILQDLTKVRFLQTVRRDFISNISHELRTPLAAVQAVVETLQDGALEDAEVAHRFLGRAEREIETLTQMVEELLELSRIESGEVPLRLAPTAICDLVAEPVARLRPQAERHGIELTVTIPDDLPLVLADGPRMQRVVANLLHNAIKFTPDGGAILISAAADGEEAPGEVVTAVKDNGLGIAAADLERIFERFYKLDRARTRGKGGTGLGLAIARHLVQAHGGRIWVKSKEGRGSTFYFSLPASR